MKCWEIPFLEKLYLPEGGCGSVQDTPQLKGRSPLGKQKVNISVYALNSRSLSKNGGVSQTQGKYLYHQTKQQGLCGFDLSACTQCVSLDVKGKCALGIAGSHF